MARGKKGNSGFFVVILFLCIIAIGFGGYIVSNKNTNNNDKNKKETNVKKYNVSEKEKNEDKKLLSGKINIKDYCPTTGECQKDIGNISLNNETLKLSVNIKDVNTENISGTITLGSKELDISTLSYYGMEKRIDGIEIYQDNLILYMSSLETTKTASENCKIRGYVMYFLDNNLKEKSSISGYTKENPLTDLKIEDGYLYHYALTDKIPEDAKNVTQTYVLVYEKTKIDKIISKDYKDASEHISTISECQLGES